MLELVENISQCGGRGKVSTDVHSDIVFGRLNTFEPFELFQWKDRVNDMKAALTVIIKSLTRDCVRFSDEVSPCCPLSGYAVGS